MVGRFFRAIAKLIIANDDWVLIPMWWGGFSEAHGGDGGECLGLNPHVVGRFFRERRVVFFIKFKCLKWPISKLQIFTKINGD